MSSRCWGALEATGRSTIKVVGILVNIKLRSTGMSIPTVDTILAALKTIVDRNVNSLYCRIFVAPESYVVNSDS